MSQVVGSMTMGLSTLSLPSLDLLRTSSHSEPSTPRQKFHDPPCSPAHLNVNTKSLSLGHDLVPSLTNLRSPCARDHIPRAGSMSAPVTPRPSPSSLPPLSICSPGHSPCLEKGIASPPQRPQVKRNLLFADDLSEGQKEEEDESSFLLLDEFVRESMHRGESPSLTGSGSKFSATRGLPPRAGSVTPV
jgi:hypothetical protein